MMFFHWEPFGKLHFCCDRGLVLRMLLLHLDAHSEVWLCQDQHAAPWVRRSVVLVAAQVC